MSAGGAQGAMNYYEVLEIDPASSKDEIERAFKRLARQVHPDLTGGDRAKADARMKQLNEIRDTLTDPLLRAGYDERLRLERERAHAAQAAAEQTGAPASPPERPRAPVTARRIGTSNPTLIGVLLLGTSISTGLLWYFRHYLPAQAAASRAAEAGQRPPPPEPEPPPAPRPVKAARPRPRNYVRLGARLEEVIRGLGTPDRVEPGKRSGDATLYYGALKLEITNGRLSSGEPPH